jgi:hypothetical protein
LLCRYARDHGTIGVGIDTHPALPRRRPPAGSRGDADRYTAQQWLTVSDWLAAHRDDPDADEIRRIMAEWRRLCLSCLRRCFGWGVVVLREQR